MRPVLESQPLLQKIAIPAVVIFRSAGFQAERYAYQMRREVLIPAFATVPTPYLSQF